MDEKDGEWRRLLRSTTLSIPNGANTHYRRMEDIKNMHCIARTRQQQGERTFFIFIFCFLCFLSLEITQERVPRTIGQE
jgi:hypothetical protein